MIRNLHPLLWKRIRKSLCSSTIFISSGIIFALSNLSCSNGNCRPDDPSCDTISALVLARALQCSYRKSWNKVGSTEGNPDNLQAVTFSSIVEGPDGFLYAAGEASNGNDAAVVMRSEDGGANWVTEWVHQPTLNAAAITQILRSPDGSLIAVGNHNPDGTNTEVFLARKAPGGSFTVTAIYERQDTNVSRALAAVMGPSGTIFVSGNAAVPTDIAGMLLMSGGNYTSLTPRTLLTDGTNPVLFSAIDPLSEINVAVGGFIDSGASKEFTLGLSLSDGSYSSILRNVFSCCLGDPELHDPTGLYQQGNGRYVMGLTPGTNLTDLRGAVLDIAPDGSFVSTEVDPNPAALTSLKIHGINQVASLFVPSGATGTPQINIRTDGEATFRVSFPPNTDGIILNDAPEESIRLVETHMLSNGDLLLPLPIHNSIVASEPVWIYRLACR